MDEETRSATQAPRCALEDKSVIFARDVNPHLEALLAEAEEKLKHVFDEMCDFSYRSLAADKDWRHPKVRKLREDSAVLFAKIRVLMEEGS